MPISRVKIRMSARNHHILKLYLYKRILLRSYWSETIRSENTLEPSLGQSIDGFNSMASKTLQAFKVSPTKVVSEGLRHIMNQCF
mmetsp:Transcript_19987/g.46702  ORF Transcript_19987/g.46702 Transcript_19987/m.46702 type:complete len:85 (+) Transcript_19987:440-694(+)